MNKKTKIVLFLIYLIAFLITCLGTTMAFFAIQNTQKIVGETKVSSATETSILYTVGQPLSIYASPWNFNDETKKSLTDSTTLTATLKKGNNVTEVKKHYDVEIVLDKNTFVYSTSNQTAELIITIKDPEGKEIKEIDDLEYVTVNDRSTNHVISGFDITGKLGTFSVAKNYELTATNNDEVIHVWQIDLTFVNLANSQDINKGNGLEGYARITPVEVDDENV